MWHWDTSLCKKCSKFSKKAIELINNKKLIFSSYYSYVKKDLERTNISINLNEVIKVIRRYDVEKMFLDDYNLLLALFDFFDKELSGGLKQQEDLLSLDEKDLYNRLKKAYDSYNRML